MADAALREKSQWLVRVERSHCPYCIKSRAAWEEVERAAPTRSRVVQRDHLPEAVTSVVTVPRYLLVQKGGK
eukprot:5295089-Prymnesium_polylepis.1